MTVIEVSTGEIYPIEILPVETADYKSLIKSRYFFLIGNRKVKKSCTN